MGIINKGILGGFRKKTGTVIGSSWRGKNVIRSIPSPSGKPPTQLQMDQRLKFGLVTSFLSWFSSLIDIGFGSVSNVPTPMNKAVSYHLKEAITGTSPNFELDYAKIQYSKGKLELPAGLRVTVAEAAKISFEWTDDGIDSKFKNATDMANIMVYSPGIQQFVIQENAATRADEGYILQLPSNFSGEETHCYISFSSANNKRLVSNSLYLGPFLVT